MIKGFLSFIKCVSTVGLAFCMAGCGAPGGFGKSGAEPLRVGITPDYPPVIFKQGERITGIEAELARQLSKRLGRPLYFVELRWDQQIDALLGGRTDMIMSGMSITDARRVRIQFSEPYFASGLMVLMRRKDAQKYDSPNAIANALTTIGVQRDTTADAFLREHWPRAKRIVIASPSDAPYHLQQQRIDLFLHDAPAIAWLASENEAELTGLWTFLTEEHLAWGLKRGDKELLDAVNGALEEMKKDGALRDILSYWLPYLDEDFFEK